MEKTVQDFLNELCRMIASIDEDVQSCHSDPHIHVLLPNVQDQNDLCSLMSNEKYKALCIRLARHAATTMAFQMLVLFDERRELGHTRVSPRLHFVVGTKDQCPPNHLHELLGEAMQDLGMDTDKWW